MRQPEYQITSERGANSTDTQSRGTITLAAEIINSAVHNHGDGIHPLMAHSSHPCTSPLTTIKRLLLGLRHPAVLALSDGPELNPS